MPDPFGDAAKKMGLSADKIAAAADKLQKMMSSLANSAKQTINVSAYEKRVKKGERLVGYQSDVDYSKPMSGQDDGEKRNVWQRFMDGYQGKNKGGKSTGSAKTGASSPMKGKANLAGKAGGAAGMVVAVAQELNEMRKRLEEWTTAAIESKRKLAEVSGAMANVFANREVRDMIRDMQMGNRTAGSTGRLAEAEARRKDAGAPFAAAFDNAKNEVLAVLNDNLAKLYNGVVDAINKIAEKVGLGKDLLEKFKQEGDSDAYAAFTRPGGLLDQAAKIEAAANERLKNVRRVGSEPFFRSAAPPRRLP